MAELTKANFSLFKPKAAATAADVSRPRRDIANIDVLLDSDPSQSSE
jgi:hypothetical protein